VPELDEDALGLTGGNGLYTKETGGELTHNAGLCNLGPLMLTCEAGALLEMGWVSRGDMPMPEWSLIPMPVVANVDSGVMF
jgi:hypothetical protein